MNQQMLAKVNSNWMSPLQPNKTAWFSITKEEVIAEHFKINTLNPIKQRLLHNRPWGWKDPRNTFTLDRWMDLFPKARIVHVIRNGMDVALSLNMRNKVEGEVQAEQLTDLKFCFQLWEQYVLQGERMCSKYPNSIQVK